MRDTRRRFGHPRLRGRRDARDGDAGAPERSGRARRLRSSTCSRTRNAGSRWAARPARTRSRTTPGTTSRVGSRRPTTRWRREPARRPVARAARDPGARDRDRADHLARPRLAPGPRRVHGGQLALGAGRVPLQPALGRRALAGLGHGDQGVDAAAASPLSARLLRVLRRAVRQCRPAGPRRRARARGRAASSHARPQRHDAAPRRLGVRAPDVRPLPDDRAGRLGAPVRAHPEVGATCRSRSRSASASCSSSSRSCSRACTRAARSRASAGSGCSGPVPGRASA